MTSFNVREICPSQFHENTLTIHRSGMKGRKENLEQIAIFNASSRYRSNKFKRKREEKCTDRPPVLSYESRCECAICEETL